MQDGEEVAHTTTTEGGIYKFNAVSPGEYNLKASHPEWTIEDQSASLAVTWGNVESPHRFVVTGYEVRGRVQVCRH